AAHDARVPQVAEDVLEELGRDGLRGGQRLALDRPAAGRGELHRGAHGVVGARGDPHAARPACATSGAVRAGTWRARTMWLGLRSTPSRRATTRSPTRGLSRRVAMRRASSSSMVKVTRAYALSLAEAVDLSSSIGQTWQPLPRVLHCRGHVRGGTALLARHRR